MQRFEVVPEAIVPVVLHFQCIHRFAKAVIDPYTALTDRHVSWVLGSESRKVRSISPLLNVLTGHSRVLRRGHALDRGGEGKP